VFDIFFFVDDAIFDLETEEKVKEEDGKKIIQ